MKKISDFTFVLFYILSISFSTLLISSESNSASVNIKNIDEISSEISEKGFLEKKYPVFCLSSSTFDQSSSCEKLYDAALTTWKDNSMGCKDAWIEFTFSRDIYLEFIVIQNPEESQYFFRSYKARDILLTNSDIEFSLNKELQNENLSQWIDINATTSDVYIKILSAYPGQEINGIQPLDECAIQEISFYGRDV
tara:strand:- start:1042 stop:1626 length:585 start_codon:yes stop_codon:yes gene_type:complete